MLTKLRNMIVQMLKRQNFFSDADAYRFLMSYFSSIFSLLVHVLLMIVFWVFRGDVSAPKSDYPDFFIYLNFFSAIGYLIFFIFIYMRKYHLYGTLLAMQGIICSILLCLLTGIDTYGLLYLILVMIAQLKFPYSDISTRVFVMILITVLTIGCIVASYFIPPIFLLTGRMSAIMLVINVLIFISGTIGMLYASHLLDSLVRSLHEAKIEELSNQSLTDELTGLHNRRFAKRFFSKCIQGRIHASVAMLDVDDFKLINDQYGHNCGDEVIVFLSDFIQRNIRTTDVAVRWGGEEFLILAVNTSLDETFVLMEELRQKVADTIIHTREKDVSITITIGIATLENDIDSSIKACDQKMYEGKHMGKNIVIK